MRASRARSASLLVSDFTGTPADWIRQKLSLSLWPRQVEIVESVWSNQITGVVSGQKTGKTNVAGAIGIAWTALHPRGLVRVAGADVNVIKDGIWQEVRHLLGNGVAERLGTEPPHLDPATGWRLGTSNKLAGVSAKEINSIAGRSGAEQLWIIDEAFGFPDDLWEVVLGNLMGGGHLLWLTNPTATAGKPYDWATRGGCNVIQIDSRENPNFHGGCVPGLATPEGVQMIVEQFGEDSAEFDVRVAGRFPRQASAAICSLRDVEDAIARWVPSPPMDKRLILGVDVARYGSDDSTVTPRRGRHVQKPRIYHGLDTVALAGQVLRDAEELACKQRCTVCVEVDGLGAGCYDVLCSSRPFWMDVIPVCMAEAAQDPERYTNRRAELWSMAGQWVKLGQLPEDPRLKRELIAVTYDFDPKLRRRVLSKDQIKKVLGNSPDVADGLVISMACQNESFELATAPVFENFSRWGGYEFEHGFG